MGLGIHIVFVWILWVVTRTSTFGLENAYHGVSPFYPAAALSAAYVFLYGFRRSWILYVLKLFYWYLVAPDFDYFLTYVPQSMLATTGAVCLGLLLRATVKRWRTLSLPTIVLRCVLAVLVLPMFFAVLYNAYSLYFGELKADEYWSAVLSFAVGDGASNTSLIGIFVLVFAYAHLVLERRFSSCPPIFGGESFATRFVEKTSEAALKVLPYAVIVAIITFFMFQMQPETVRHCWYLVIPPVILAVIRARLEGALVMCAIVSLFLIYGVRLTAAESAPYTVLELQLFLICFNILTLVMGAFASENALRLEVVNKQQKELQVADTAKLRILTGIGEVLLRPIQSVLESAKDLKRSDEVVGAAHQALGVLEQLLEYNDLEQTGTEPKSSVLLRASVYRALVRAQKLNVGGPSLPELVFSVDPKQKVHTSPEAFSSMLDHFFSVGLRMRRVPTSPWKVVVDVKDGHPRIVMCLSEIKDEIDLTSLGEVAGRFPWENAGTGLPGGYLLSLLMVRRMAGVLGGQMILMPHLLKHGIDVRIDLGQAVEV